MKWATELCPCTCDDEEELEEEEDGSRCNFT